ncbi:MAG: stage III sporulation protein AC [Clostridia bacterium]|nr:stage III sporulation protein AC [Clostridia bacterium]
MDISLILKITGIGILISIACQILSKSGRDEQATLLSIGGIVIVMLLILTEIDTLFSTLKRIFGL